MSSATVRLLRLKMFFQRKTDSQRGGKIFNVRLNPDTRAEQFIIAADDG